ncbi:MAG: hypothetical protein KF729_15750 [Sandaracinaceae bacterium]|nr:hypothetical protein [Sandaracinaceae bacterium]
MRLAATSLAFILGSCGAPTTRSGGAQGEVVTEHRTEHGTEHAIPRIDDEAGWDRLASRPQNHHVARTSVVKFAIDLRGEEPAFHFFDSRRYESHYDFVSAELARGVFGDGMDFYRRVYVVDDRPFIVGSILRYEDAGAWTFELISGDDLAAERILWTWRALAARTFFGEALRFRPTSDLHLARVAALGERLPVARDDELYGALRYQPVQLGAAFGTLRFVRGAVARGALGPRDVLVTDEVPDDLPLVAALITSRFQAPLAHVAVLSSNRGTPDMALRGAIDDPALRALEGRLVRLEVGAQDFALREATRDEADAAWASEARATFTPPRDLRATALSDQCTLGVDDVPTAGAKAANMGVLCGLASEGIAVPPGFVIPFARYDAHLRAHRIDARVRAFLASDARRGDPTRALEALREAIRRAPVDPALLRELRARGRAIAPGGRIILRSSTNAEDLPGFTGAGLYASVLVAVDATDDALADALREVWASVWALGAFQEREHYRVDHERVAMAVLVQRALDESIASGVAISANPYDRVRPGVLINVQARGASVTGATSDQIPEQWLVLTYLPTREPELLARSSLSPTAPILRRDEVLALTRQLETIHRAFTRQLTAAGSNAVDVEMMLTGPERRFVIVQARPYRVTWRGRE